jgi:hypothetical protein
VEWSRKRRSESVRRGVRAVLALAVVAGVGSFSPELADAQPPEQSILVKGKVIGPDGAPASGAAVEFSVWPNADTLAAVAKAADVTPLLLSTVRTTSAGSYLVA